MVSGSPRVLIAADEPQLLRVRVRALEKSGISIVSASDGVFLRKPFPPRALRCVVEDSLTQRTLE